MSKAYTANGKRRSSQTHAKRVRVCPCGKVCRGNGGWSSHKAWHRRHEAARVAFADPLAKEFLDKYWHGKFTLDAESLGALIERVAEEGRREQREADADVADAHQCKPYPNDCSCSAAIYRAIREGSKP